MRRKSERHRTSRSQPICLRIEPLERKSCPAAMLTISLAEPFVLEGEAVTCYVTLTEPARVTERVYLTMANKTATYGSDYFAPTSQQVMFGPGQSRKIVTFSTLRDAGLDKVEGVETFQIIATPVTQSLGTRTVTAMIADYVPLPAISIADAMVVEGSAGTTKTATLTVSLGSRYPKPVTVNYVTRDGTATVADGDYVATRQAGEMPAIRAAYKSGLLNHFGGGLPNGGHAFSPGAGNGHSIHRLKEIRLAAAHNRRQTGPGRNSFARRGGQHDSVEASLPQEFDENPRPLRTAAAACEHDLARLKPATSRCRLGGHHRRITYDRERSHRPAKQLQGHV